MLSFTRWQAYYGPNPLSENPCCIARLRSHQEISATEILSACKLVRKSWPDFFVPGEGQSLPPEEALASTIVEWTRGVLNEVRGCIQDCGYRSDASGRQEDTFFTWVGFHRPSLTRDAMELSLQVLSDALGPDKFDPNKYNSQLQDLWKLCQRHHPDYQATILMQGALQMGLPVLPFVDESKYWQFGWGKNGRIYMESASNADGFLSGRIVRNKQTTKTVLSSLGMPVPPSLVVSAEKHLGDAVSKVGWPCVTKPLDSGGGKGVTAGIGTMEELIRGFHYAKTFTAGAILVEAFVSGDDHRLMVIEGKLIAVIKRVPASVEGNGSDTIKNLIVGKNRHRSLNIRRSNYLRPIQFDKVLLEHLNGQGYTPDSVLPPGKQVFLRSNANLSTGGSCIDLTDKVNPLVRQMAEQIAVTLGLNTTGLDYLTEDISASPEEVKGAFIEANTTPGLDAAVAAGWSPERIASLVLGSHCGRIPVLLTVAGVAAVKGMKPQLVNEWRQPGRALVFEKEAWVGGVKLVQDDSHPWGHVRKVLRNQSVAILNIVCDIDSILKFGLPVDKIDVLSCDMNNFSRPWQLVLHKHSNTVEKLPGSA